MNEESLMAVLNGLRVTIIHPDAQSCRALSASLSQLGCQATYCWPVPACPPANTDLVLLASEPHYHQRAKSLMAEPAMVKIPFIVMADCQSPAMFPLLLELKPAAILDKMINPFALIVQIIATMRLVRECNLSRLRAEQVGKNDKQKLAQAKGILMFEHGMDENTAYHFMRREAMNSRRSLSSTAEGVIRHQQRAFPE
ncbi:ANTAR domain-containing response regulator [Tatumella citrea]|uniref:ANTAR domain-containing protein n=1 Tax=Tatumella citrea TaxID=53336 RepID=A0A1Y0L4U1_TATCI|nr:ANTAR domain-containing protein [Tatumella citrea]ARU92699.1 hypothetical protein A7K98_02145 [Tatumella citrea]ARU96736.1 hypothetical protein A7K99_02145 [Tatumella citrea]